MPIAQVNVVEQSDMWWDCRDEAAWTAATTVEEVDNVKTFGNALRAKYCAAIRDGTAVDSMTFVRLANPAPLAQQQEKPVCTKMTEVIANAKLNGNNVIKGLMLSDYSKWLDNLLF